MNKVVTARHFFPSYQQIFGISLLSLYTAISMPTSTIAAPAAKLNSWRFYPEKLQLEITLSAVTTPRYFYLAQPPRLVVDIPNTKLGRVLTQKNYSGAIQSIRVSQLTTDVTRIVLDLAPGTSLDYNQVQLRPLSRQNPTRWVLRPVNLSNNSTSSQPPYLPSSPNNLSPTPDNYQQQPFVTVPALTPNSSSQLPDFTLPPATFPNQFGNNITVPEIPNNPAPLADIKVIEFGQPLPKER